VRFCWLLLGVLFAAVASAQELTRVTVVHQKTYNVVITLSDAKALAAFERRWKAKTRSSIPQEPNWLYKIDIETTRNSDRWLYDPRGWTKLRSNTETSVYKLPAPDEFNTSLGIKRGE